MRLRGILPLALCTFAAANLAAQSSPPGAASSPLATQTPPPATAPPQPYPTGAETPLGAQIHDLLLQPSAARAHWGIAVTTLDGAPVYGLDEEKLFRPASTAKLFTTAAAMALLGPEKRFTTAVYGTLNATTGRVNGDLVIVGGGDPGFGTTETAASPNNDLKDLADQLVAKGVRSITGNIVGDDDLFQQEPPPEGWAAEDLPWGYGALPNALSYSDNELRLTISPHPSRSSNAKTDEPAAALLQLDQAVPFVHLANNVATEPPDAGHRDYIDVQPLPGRAHAYEVLGAISPTASPVIQHIALPDPAQYTAEALRALLAQHRIIATGRTSAWHNTAGAPQPFLASLRAPDDCETSTVQGGDCSLECATHPHPDQLLAQHTSAPLADDVKFTLKTSANLHAEVFLRQLEARITCAGATSLGGARLLRAWLLQAGLSDGEFILYDGSGLSTKDLVTPRAEAHLLAYAATQPWYAQWRAGLPIAGTDGTLAGRFTSSPLKGKLSAKTGTLGETRALAGYVQCASGRELILSIMVDNHDPTTPADRLTMDKIAEAIAANN